MTNPHLDVGVTSSGPAPEDADLVVVAVHGRNQDPRYLLDHLVGRLELPGIAWLLPAAADGSWYPAGFLAPFAENQPWLDHALEAMAAMEASLDGVDSGRVVWAGFSQGACLVSEHLARRPRRWGGLLAFTGGRIGPEGTDLAIHGGFDGMPAYFGVGDHDEWVPEPRVHQTADAYEAAGAEVTLDVFADLDHVIRDAEIDRARHVLERARRGA